MPYTATDYELLLNTTWVNINTLQTLKGGEYSKDTDRLANFRAAANDLNLPMEVVWLIYFNKHIDAIKTYVRDLAHDKSRPRSEPIEGRFHDAIVYLTLGLAIIDEKKRYEIIDHDKDRARAVEQDS